MKLFTIGFAGKKAREFFGLLADAGVKRVIDVRLNNVSQLAGFTKRADLEYFLSVIVGIDYVHIPGFAPEKDLLKAYRAKQVKWPEYEQVYLALMMQRRTESLVTAEDIDLACLLCSEAKPEKCHRRLAAEYLRRRWEHLEIVHL